MYLLLQSQQRMLTVIILLDFSKAFDTLNHVILMKKFINLKFSSNVLSLITSFLHGRVVQTVVNNKSSKWENIYAGVVGPTLFKIYVSDLTFLMMQLFIVMTVKFCLHFQNVTTFPIFYQRLRTFCKLLKVVKYKRSCS